MSIIQIKDIQFGNIDARNEIFSRDHTKQELFLKSFCAPPSFNLEEIINGDKCIVCGPKGSGKTAVLRYIQHQLKTMAKSPTKFVVFRDDVTDQKRQKIIDISSLRSYDNSVEDFANSEVDCLSAWQLFIHREIAQLIEESGDLCAKTNDVKDYIKLVSGVFSQFSTSKFKSIVSKITKGKIKIGALGQSLEAEAEFIDVHGNLDVTEFVRYCDGIVSCLDFNSEIQAPRMNIFFDEINVTFVSGKKFKQDAALVRDLIAASCKMNSMFSENSIPIYIYSAIRSEVVDSIESSVRELQKWIDDMGVSINWIEAKKTNRHPIIDVLHKRLNANECMQTGREIPLSKTNLLDYFEKNIKNYTIEKYLVNETWGRPRDLVRLLTEAQKFVERDQKIGIIAFNKSAINYSRSCWDEKRDELNTKYSQSQIETIKRSLTGFRNVFSYTQFEGQVSHQSRNDSRSIQFFQDRNLDVLLEDLFKVGILGNMLKNNNNVSFPYYGYTGNTNFSPQQLMCIHKSLWQELRLEQPSNKQKQPNVKSWR